MAEYKPKFDWGDGPEEATASLFGDLMNPDVAAKTLANSAERGIPFALNTADPEDFNKQSMIERAQEVTQDNPVLQRYFANNDFAPHVSHDDAQNLGFVANAIQSLNKGFRAGQYQVRAGETGAKAKFLKTELPPEAKAFYDKYEEAQKQIPEGAGWHTLAGFSSFIGGIVEATQEIDRKYPWKAPETMAEVAQLPGEAVAHAARLIPGAIMSGLSVARGAGVEVYERQRREAAAKGLPFDADAAAAAGTIVSLANLALLKVGPVPEAEAFLKEIAASALENGVVKRGLAYHMRELGKAGAIFSGANTAGTFIDTFAEDLARQASSPEFQTIFNDPQKRSELKDNLIGAAAIGFGLGTVMHTPHVGISYLNDRILVKQAKVDKANYDELERRALATQTYERSPEAFRRFYDEAADAAGREGRDLSIPADAIIEAFGEDSLEKFDFVPDFEAKLKAAYETGGDVQMSMKDWLLALKDRPELKQALKDDLRHRPGGLTTREADALDAAKPEDYETEFAPRVRTAVESTERPLFTSTPMHELFGEDVRAGDGSYVPTRETYKLADVLQNINLDHLKGIPSDLARFFRNKFSDLIGDMEVRVISDNDMIKVMMSHGRSNKDARLTPGFHQTQDGKRFIVLRESFFKQGDEAQVAQVVLHEAAHGITVNEMAANPRMNAIVKLLMNDTKTLLEETDPELHEKHSYAWTNEKEFIAEAFSNPDFQKLLSLTPVSEGLAAELKLDKSTHTMWDAMKELVKQVAEKLFGMKLDPTTMDALLRVGEHLEAEGEARREAGITEFASPEETFFAEAEKAAKRALWLKPMTKLQGMIGPEFAKYSKKFEAEDAAARERATKGAAKEIAKRQTEEWKANEKEVKTQVTMDLSYKPELMADTFFRTGRYPGVARQKPFKLDESIIRERYGAEGLAAMDPKTVAKKGLDPDDAAGLFGYDSGEAMIRGMQKVHKERGEVKPEAYTKGLIEAETADRMEHQYGVLSRNIHDEVLEMQGTSGQADLLSDELHYLQILATHPEGLPEGETIPPKEITREMVEAHARRSTDQALATKVVRTDDLVRDIGKEGRTAELSLLGGKIKKAFFAKQRQSIGLAMLDVAKEFKKIFDKTERRIERFSKKDVVPGVSQEYTDQVHNLLSMVQGKIPRTEENLGEALAGKSLDQFINDKGAEGWAVPPPNLPRGEALKDFTVAEYRDFAATLEGLETMGRREKQIQVRDKLIDFEEAVATATDQAASLKGTFNPRDIKGLRSVFRWFDSRFIKPEQLFDWLDKNDPTGIFNTIVFRPLSEAEHWALDKLRKEIAPAVRKLPRISSKEMGQKLDNQTLKDPQGGMMNITRGNMLKMALYWGTETGREKLTKGWGWEPADVEAFLKQHLTKKDLDFLHGTWDTLGLLAPDIKRVTKAMTGVAIDMLEPTPFETQHGTARGGYVPLTEDAYERIQRGKVKPEEDLFAGKAFQRLPTTQAIKRRTGKMYPLSLELDDIGQVITDTVHYLAFAEPMRDARKFLNDTRVRRGISEAFGPEYTEHLDPWLNHISTNGGLENDQALHRFWKFSRFMRGNAQFMAIGLNEITAELHGGSAAANSVQEVGLKNIGTFAKAGLVHVPKDALESVVRYMTASEKNLGTVTAEVFEKSAEIRNRKLKLDENMQAMYKLAIGHKWSTMRASFHQFGMSLIGLLDQWSAVATWKAVYDGALKKGVAEADAIYTADKAVRNAHGASGITDLPAIQRGPEPLKWATMFMTYFVHNYNRNRDTARIAEGKTELDTWGRWGTVAARSVLYVAFPAWWHHYLRGKPDDKKSWGEETAEAIASQLGGSVPYVRDMIYSYETHRGSRQMLDDVMDGIVAPITDAMHALKGEKVSDAWVRHTLEFPGWTLGAMSKHLARGLMKEGQYWLWDIPHGTERVPQNFSEFYRGITTGHTDEPKAKKKSHH